jgi:hypothetical protein
MSVISFSIDEAHFGSVGTDVVNYSRGVSEERAGAN